MSKTIVLIKLKNLRLHNTYINNILLNIVVSADMYKRTTFWKLNVDVLYLSINDIKNNEDLSNFDYFNSYHYHVWFTIFFCWLKFCNFLLEYLIETSKNPYCLKQPIGLLLSSLLFL